MSNSTYKLLQMVTYVKAQLSVTTETHERTEVVTTIEGAAPVVVMTELPKPIRSYRLSLHSNSIGDEVKIRLTHLPEYIDIPRMNGYQAFAAGYNEAKDKTLAEEAAIRNSSEGGSETV